MQADQQQIARLKALLDTAQQQLQQTQEELSTPPPASGTLLRKLQVLSAIHHLFSPICHSLVL